MFVTDLRPNSSEDAELEAFMPEAAPRASPMENETVNDMTRASSSGMTRAQALNLYTSHLLSTWNARTYEFAAIIFTASAYPDTLTASSTRGIISTIASIALSASLGRWIDRSPNRLKTLLTTITINRLSVIIACCLWISIVSDSKIGVKSRSSLSNVWIGVVFALVLGLGVLEKLSGTANMISMERDWVVVVAAPDGRPYNLTHLNAVMRRIDLSCKLLSPLLISVVISASSVKAGVLVVGGMSATSWIVEWWCARKVWRENIDVQTPKTPVESQAASTSADPPPYRRLFDRFGVLSSALLWLSQHASDFAGYFSSRVWIPSFALSILHISVLSYSATFITYLLNAGFSLNLITIARAVGSVVEITSTIVTPFGVEYLGKAHHHRGEQEEEEEEEVFLEDPSQLSSDIETGLERLGLWGITWQLLNLIPVALSLWALSPSPTPAILQLLSRLTGDLATQSPTILAITVFTFLSLSRLGLWIFDLTTQQLEQTLVPPNKRASFAGVENSFVSVFELLHHVSAILLSKPSQFQWLATGSLGAVAVSTALYAGWVWRQRGHLLHWERVGKVCDCAAQWRRDGYSRART